MSFEDLIKGIKTLLDSVDEVKMLINNTILEIQEIGKEVQLLKLDVRDLKNTVKSVKADKGKMIINERPSKSFAKLKDLKKPENLFPNTLEYRLWNHALPSLLEKQKENEENKKSESC